MMDGGRDGRKCGSGGVSKSPKLLGVYIGGSMPSRVGSTVKKETSRSLNIHVFGRHTSIFLFSLSLRT
jgi:hypothetical protein